MLEQRESVSVDFAIFGPHGDRLIKMRKFDTMVQGPDGRMHRVEMLGPSTYREWLSSYRVFRTLCIMFDVIVPAWLDRYARKVQRYNDEHPEAWGVIYQTDVRARLEHALEVRERLEAAHATAIANNMPSSHDPR